MLNAFLLALILFFGRAGRSLANSRVNEEPPTKYLSTVKFGTEPRYLIDATDLVGVTFGIGESFHKVKLHPNQNLYHSSATILRPHGTGFKAVERPKGLLTLSSATSDPVKASITVTRDGSFAGTVFFNGQVNLLESVGGADGIRKLEDHAENEVYAVDVTVTELGKEQQDTRLRGLQLNPRLNAWTGCYPGDDQFHFLDIGIATDLSYFEKFGTVDAALANIENFIASTNIIYASQLHIFLRLQQVLIIQADSDISPGNEFQFFRQTISGSQGKVCVPTAPQLLSEFSKWVARVPSSGDSSAEAVQHATWELLTACYEFGTVGSAFVSTQNGQSRGTLCEAGVNCGVSSMTSRGFVTFAHEVGHNLGSGHSFENGEGKTGGIMDNGNGFFEGEIQFREARRPEICVGLSRAKAKCGSKFPAFDSVCTTETKCDNGVCENGECKEMKYVFNISNADVVHEFASEELATSLTVPTFLESSYVVLRNVEANNRFACNPLQNVGPTNQDKFLLIEDLPSASGTLESCSYLTRAQNIKNRGFAGALIFNPEKNDDSIELMELTVKEKSEDAGPVKNFVFVYITPIVGGILTSRQLLVQAGWEFLDSDKNFEAFQNSNVPEQTPPGSLTFAILVATLVGLVVLSLFILFFAKSENATIVAVRESFVARVHIGTRGSSMLEDIEFQMDLSRLTFDETDDHVRRKQTESKASQIEMMQTSEKPAQTPDHSV